jgi:GAF domain-containing protein
MFLGASELLTDSLDYDTVLETISRIALPHLADWSSVYTPGDGALVARLVVAHRNPAKEALLSTVWQQWNRHLPESHPHVRAMRSGRILTVAGEAASAASVTPATCEQAVDIVERVGVGTILTVPLIAHGTVLGSLMLVRSRAGAHQVLDDELRHLVSDLATCGAQAIHNARLFREAKLAARERDETIANATLTLIELLERLHEHLDGIREVAARGTREGQSQLKRGLAQIELLVREMQHVIRDSQTGAGSAALNTAADFKVPEPGANQGAGQPNCDRCTPARISCL